MDRIFFDQVCDIVRPAVDHTTLDPAARQPTRKGTGVVIAALGTLTILSPGGATKLSTKDEQRIVKQSTAFEVLDQHSNRLVDAFGILGMRCHIAMSGVPIVRTRPNRVDDFDKSDTTLDEPTGHDALSGIRFYATHLRTVKFEGFDRLLSQVQRFGRCTRKSLCCVERRDTADKLTITIPIGKMETVWRILRNGKRNDYMEEDIS